MARQLNEREWTMPATTCTWSVTFLPTTTTTYTMMTEKQPGWLNLITSYTHRARLRNDDVCNARAHCLLHCTCCLHCCTCIHACIHETSVVVAIIYVYVYICICISPTFATTLFHFTHHYHHQSAQWLPASAEERGRKEGEGEMSHICGLLAVLCVHSCSLPTTYCYF